VQKVYQKLFQMSECMQWNTSNPWLWSCVKSFYNELISITFVIRQVNNVRSQKQHHFKMYHKFPE